MPCRRCGTSFSLYYSKRRDGYWPMITVDFSAFMFLQAKLKERGIDHTNARREIPDDTTVDEFLAGLGLGADDVEAVFVDGKVVPGDTRLSDGNRLALVPPGSPGPYRVLLGMVKPDATT